MQMWALDFVCLGPAPVHGIIPLTRTDDICHTSTEIERGSHPACDSPQGILVNSRDTSAIFVGESQGTIDRS